MRRLHAYREPMRDAARLLQTESIEIVPILESLDSQDFNRPTVCDLWSVRDVIAHCAAVLHDLGMGEPGDFTPEANQRGVDLRSTWSLTDLITDLSSGYEAAIHTIDTTPDRFDGIARGEWLHGGDIRDALDMSDAYTSAGVEIAVDLFHDRSTEMKKRAIVTRVDGTLRQFGADTDPVGRLATDTETFVRLCGNRRPDPSRWTGDGVEAGDFNLYT